MSNIRSVAVADDVRRPFVLGRVCVTRTHVPSLHGLEVLECAKLIGHFGGFYSPVVFFCLWSWRCVVVSGSWFLWGLDLSWGWVIGDFFIGRIVYDHVTMIYIRDFVGDCMGLCEGLVASQNLFSFLWFPFWGLAIERGNLNLEIRNGGFRIESTVGMSDCEFGPCAF